MGTFHIMKNNANRNPRRLATTRAPRFDTWLELQRAVLKWCRERITEETPDFDVTALEGQLRGWVSDWAADNDEAYTRLSGLVDAVARQTDTFARTRRRRSGAYSRP